MIDPTETALKFGLDPNLVKAIITVESGGNPLVMRYEAGTPDRYLYFAREHASQLGTSVETEIQLQKFSFGPLQLMGWNARSLGFRDYLIKLCSTDLGISYGCMFLKQLMQRFGTEMDVVSAYNQGTPRKTPGGMYMNQGYCDKVATVLRQLRVLRD